MAIWMLNKGVHMHTCEVARIKDRDKSEKKKESGVEDQLSYIVMF